MAERRSATRPSSPADAAGASSLSAEASSESSRKPPSGNRPAGEAPPRPARDRFTAVLVALSLLGAGLALARGAAHGAALHWDSINYLAAARNLLSGEGLLNFSGTIYTLWPPLYPLLLAVSSLGVLDPLTVAGPLNAALFAAAIFAAGRYLRRRLRSSLSPFVALSASVLLALSLPLGDLAWWALAGPLFVLLTILALIRAERYLAEGRTGPLVWCGVLSALAWQARYIGIAVPAAVALSLLWFDRRTAFPKRARRAVLFFGAAAAPMALWFARNYHLTGRLTRNREPVEYTLAELSGDLVSGLSSWARFDFGGWPSLLAAALLPAVAIFIGRRPGAGAGPDAESNSRPGAGPAGVFGVFIAVYLVALFGALFAGTTWHGLQERFLAPLFAPAVIVLVTALDRFLERRRAAWRPPSDEGTLARVWPLWGRLRARGPVGIGAAVALSLWAAGQIEPNAEAVRRANAPNLVLENGYNAEPWKSSETLRYLRENEIPAQIFSNEAAATYHHTWRRATSGFLDRSVPIGSVARPRSRRNPEDQLRRWLRRRAVDGALVVWFRARDNTAYDYGPPQMWVTPGFEPVAELTDGVIFRVARGYRPPTNRYRDAWDALASGAFGEPVAREAFDLYLDPAGRRLLYAKEPCPDEAPEPKFLFHLFPADEEALPTRHREFGFENRDFSFPEYGLRFGDRCVAIVPLPDEDLARVRTGQWLPGEEPLWTASFRLDRERLRAELASVSSGARGEPAARSAFDLYLDGRSLTYLKESCAPEDRETPFFLHLYAESPEALPEESRGVGFENRDFDFSAEGLLLDGKCIAVVRLPGYALARIRTGQWRRGEGELWAVDIPPSR